MLFRSSDDSYQRPAIPAWEFLEAVPFVLEAVLTACSHGRISSRDMTTSEEPPPSHFSVWHGFPKSYWDIS